MPCPSTLQLQERSLPDWLLEGGSLHKAICDFFNGEDKAKGVGNDVCVDLLSVPAQGPVEPSRLFFRVLGSCCWLQQCSLEIPTR